MKKLILDHFRRWWWVLALGAAYALVLGWSVAIPADSGELWHGKKKFPARLAQSPELHVCISSLHARVVDGRDPAAV
jgi:hypothetical protein